MTNYKDMVNEEFNDNEENISPSTQNCMDDRNLHREYASILVGSTVLKASICTKHTNPLISKQCTTKDG